MKNPQTPPTTAFPPPPVTATPLLAPITSWADMHSETATTGVQFELFWYDRVQDGVAYFFSWSGEPRCTVLVVWDNSGTTHIECRKTGDLPATPTECLPIIAEVTQAFRTVGFSAETAKH